MSANIKQPHSRRKATMHLDLRYTDIAGKLKNLKFEQVKAMPVHWKEKNPNKNVLFRKDNSIGERFELVHYKDTGKLFLIVKGGSHESFWLLDEYTCRNMMKAIMENKPSN